MKIADFCIKRRVTTILAFIMVVIFGAMSFTSLPLALMPDIELPMAIVMTVYAGAGPEEVESQVTESIESAVASVAGLDELTSRSQENMSLVMAQFDYGTDMDQTLIDIRDKVDRVKSSLPDDADTPTVMKMDVDSMPVVMFGLTGSDLAQLQAIADDEISTRLERIDGVSSVDVSGGYENEVAIEADMNQLESYGMTIAYLSQMLAADNVAIPAGEVHNGTQELTVRVDGEYQSVDDIRNTIIPLPAGGTIRLGQVAEVSLKPKDQDSIAKVDGEPCVMVSVSKQSGVNTVKVAEQAMAAMDEIQAEDASLHYTILMDQSDYINLTVNNVIENIVMGVILAALVLLLFLRDLNATVVISISMPVCIVSVFLIMKAADITLNMMSLGGLALGVGMIVDNSIVVLENIYRFRSDGFSRWDSCTKGAAEVTGSIIGGTLTTIVIFLPIALSGGMSGMMFREFCLTICSLLAASLIIAMTLVPLLCYITMDRGGRKLRANNKHGDKAESPLMRKYQSLMRFLLKRRMIAVVVSVAFIVVAFAGAAATGFELIPDMDQGEVSVEVSMPTGSSMEETAEIEDRISAIAMDTIPELDSIYYSTSGMTALSSGGGSVTISLVDLEERDRSANEIANELRKNLEDIAGCELSVSTSSTMSSMSGDAISLTLSGDDYDELTQTGDELVDLISALPDAIEVESSAAEQEPRVTVQINRENATRFGLNAATIGGVVRAQVDGSTATTIDISGDEYDITISGDEAAKANLDALKSLMVSTSTGGSVPLSLVADVHTEMAPQTIERQNQSRTITVTGDSLSGDTAGINEQVNQILADYEMPQSVTLETGGEMADIAESFGTLMTALVVALALVYFVLASQFESFIMPVIIMMILPTSLLGSLLGLALTGNKISMVALIGVIILAGTVVNSPIVLIEYIKTRRESFGEDKNTAILNACPRRVRPVLMTALTTILGMVPMIVDTGEGSEMMRPMAIVMIVGMVLSTIVTLVFTPVYYSLIDSLSEKFRRSRPDDGEPADTEEEATVTP